MDCENILSTLNQHDAVGETSESDVLWESRVMERVKLGLGLVPYELTAPCKLTHRYRLEKKLGAGGFGTVYRGFDNELNRSVAIKVPSRRYADARYLERARQEASRAAQINHQRVAQIYDVEEGPDSRPFLVMEFIEGMSLADWRKDIQYPDLKVVAGIIRDASEGLAVAHQVGLIHRDVKSANILLAHDETGDVNEQAGSVKLIDFGIAIEADKAGSLSGGTLDYMSPEHLTPRAKVDARSDIFGMGVVLFEMLTGTLPFRGTPSSIKQKILTGDGPLVSEFNDRIPLDLVAIVHRCLQVNPEDRYQDARELRDDLAAWIENRPVKARPPSVAGRIYRWGKREPWVASLTSILIVGLTTGIVYYAVTNAALRALNKSVERGMDREMSINTEVLFGATPPLFELPGTEPILRELNTVLSQAIGGLKQEDRAQGFTAQLERLQLAEADLRARLELSAGDAESALKIQREVCEQAGNLAARHPGNFVLQHFEALSKIRLADRILAGPGSRDEALELFEQARRILEHLAENAAEDARYQDSLCVTYDRLARMARERGDWSGAEQLLQQAVSRRTELLGAIRGDDVVQYNLVASLQRLAEINELNGDSSSSVDRLKQAEALLVPLRKSNPGNVSYIEASAVVTERLTAFFRADRPAEARERLLEASRDFEVLRRLFPESSRYLIRHAAVIQQIGDCNELTKDGPAADKAYRSAVELLKQLPEAEVTPEANIIRGQCESKLAISEVTGTRDVAAALQLATSGVVHFRAGTELLKSPEILTNFAAALNVRSQLLRIHAAQTNDETKLQEAEADFREAISVLDSLQTPAGLRLRDLLLNQE
jgi:tetratricopeptide (TPR) repeat protein